LTGGGLEEDEDFDSISRSCLESGGVCEADVSVVAVLESLLMMI